MLSQVVLHKFGLESNQMFTGDVFNKLRSRNTSYRTFLCQFPSKAACVSKENKPSQTCKLVCKQVCKHGCTHVCKRMFKHVFKHVYKHLCKHVCKHVCKYLCKHVCRIKLVACFEKMLVSEKVITREAIASYYRFLLHFQTTNCALRLKFQSKRKLKKSKHTLLTFSL